MTWLDEYKCLILNHDKGMKYQFKFFPFSTISSLYILLFTFEKKKVLKNNNIRNNRLVYKMIYD